MANSTKRDLILDVARSTGYTQVEIRAVVEELLKIVRETLVAGERIEIRNFGTFSTRERLPRAARNPKTGVKVRVERNLAPVFKFSSELRAQIAGVREAEQAPEAVSVVAPDRFSVR